MVRTPSPTQSLQTLAELLSFRVSTIIDIGVQGGTPFLYRSFPLSHHILYEPVEEYLNIITKNYQTRVKSFEVRHCALSDFSGILKLHLISGDKSGSITHSHIRDTDCSGEFGDKLIKIVDIPVSTLDDDFTNLDGPYLVKIDVDGKEDEIIMGGVKTLNGATAIVCEAQLCELSQRISSLEALGFCLYDIIGNAYYFDQLQQVDIVMVRADVMQAQTNLQPWKKGPLNWMRWSHYDN